MMKSEGIRCKKCDTFIPRNKGLDHLKNMHHYKMGDDYSFDEFFEVIAA